MTPLHRLSKNDVDVDDDDDDDDSLPWLYFAGWYTIIVYQDVTLLLRFDKLIE